MQKIFLAEEGFERSFNRRLAKGHKMVQLNEDVESMMPIAMKTDGDVLRVERVEESNDDEIYTVLCKSFGLVGYQAGLKSKVSVIFCDDGWMLVTLLEGGIVINLGGKPVLPTVGDFNVPSISESDILWISANNLLGYNKYLGMKGRFMYDVEFVFQLGGGVHNNLTNFTFKSLSEEDIDLSLGYIAQYEQKLQLQQQQKEATALRNALIGKTGTDDMLYEFDDDEDTEEDGIIEDDDGSDWG